MSKSVGFAGATRRIGGLACAGWLRSLTLVTAAALVLSTGFAAGDRALAQPVEVDVELAIAVDVSGSMSDREHEVQRQGFLAAFADEELLRAIRSGLRGRIAVTYFEWASYGQQQVLVPWRVISDAASANAFREELAPKPRTPIRGTSVSGALTFGASLFEGNGIESFRQVIDVSGDGANRSGPPVDKVRDAVVAKGIVINGLPIMLSPMVHSMTHGFGLDRYFEDCVIGGTGAFVYPVMKESELAEAIRRKLIIEIGARPPGSPRVIRVSDPVRPGGAFPLGGARREGPPVDCQLARRYRDDW